MTRLYRKDSIQELEGIFEDNRHSRPVLAELREELFHRNANRAKSLLRDILGLLDGDVPMPTRPPRPDDPEHQLGFDGID